MNLLGVFLSRKFYFEHVMVIMEGSLRFPSFLYFDKKSLLLPKSSADNDVIYLGDGSCRSAITQPDYYRTYWSTFTKES